MKQHRFDKNFKMIIEAVQEVYNENHHEISDEELEEYYSSFSEAEVDKVVSDALKQIQENGSIFENEEELEEGIRASIKSVIDAFKSGYRGEKGHEKEKDDTKPSPSNKPKKTSIGSKIKHAVKAFKSGSVKSTKHGVKAGIKSGKQSYKSQQGKEKSKINKKPPETTKPKPTK